MCKGSAREESGQSEITDKMTETEAKFMGGGGGGEKDQKEKSNGQKRLFLAILILLVLKVHLAFTAFPQNQLHVLRK